MGSSTFALTAIPFSVLEEKGKEKILLSILRDW